MSGSSRASGSARTTLRNCWNAFAKSEPASADFEDHRHLRTVQCGSEWWRNLYHKPARTRARFPSRQAVALNRGDRPGFQREVPRGSTLTTPSTAESVNAATDKGGFFCENAGVGTTEGPESEIRQHVR